MGKYQWCVVPTFRSKKKSYWKRCRFTLSCYWDQVHRDKTVVLEVPREAEKYIARSTVTCRTMWLLQSSSSIVLGADNKKKQKPVPRTHRSRVIAYLPSFNIRERVFNHLHLVGIKEQTQELRNRLKSLGSSSFKWLCDTFPRSPKCWPWLSYWAFSKLLHHPLYPPESKTLTLSAMFHWELYQQKEWWLPFAAQTKPQLYWHYRSVCWTAR